MKSQALPRHVAIIMDGNGRWATARGLPRSEGHRQGLAAAKRIVLEASRRGIDFLSLYTFSTENWRRTSDEIGFLMSLIQAHLTAELDFYRENGIKVVHSGRRDELSAELLNEIDKVVSDTSGFPGMVVNLALNYGGRDEIARALSRCMRARWPEDFSPVSELAIRAQLDHPEIPDPDLVIRTGGEYRISNFLLWQCAYSEFHFTDRLWPDFSGEDLSIALEEYSGRDRRFGGTR